MWLILAGLLAGLMDSIAGGGGLITLPTLMLEIGPGAHAIGSNKIPGFVAAFAALVVYWRRGHLEWRSGLVFSAAISVGAYAGSQATPLLPREAFRYLMAATLPIILFIVFFGKRLRSSVSVAAPAEAASIARLLLAGGLVGFYDGAWGPGGGTFMVLGLLYGAHLELLPALATAKLANSCSALFSGVGYWSAGHVDVRAGLAVAAGALLGAVLGARLASRQAERVARPALIAVAVLLLWRVWGV